MCRKKKTTVLNCVKWVKNVYVWNPGKKIILSGTTEKNWVKRNGKRKKFSFWHFFSVWNNWNILCKTKKNCPEFIHLLFFFPLVFPVFITDKFNQDNLAKFCNFSISQWKNEIKFQEENFFFFFSWELLFHVWIRVKILVIPMFKTSTGKMSLTKRSSVG